VHHARKPGDQPRRLDAPHCLDRAMSFGGHASIKA
jgi:hypothetical protein